MTCDRNPHCRVTRRISQMVAYPTAGIVDLEACVSALSARYPPLNPADVVVEGLALDLLLTSFLSAVSTAGPQEHDHPLIHERSWIQCNALR